MTVGQPRWETTDIASLRQGERAISGVGVGDECKHLLPVEQCHLCKPPPDEVIRPRYRTEGGRAFHNDPDRDWLRKGHNRSRQQGKETHDAVPIRWADAKPGELHPCKFYRTSQWLRRRGKNTTPAAVAAPPEPEGTPCEVREGDLRTPRRSAAQRVASVRW